MTAFVERVYPLVTCFVAGVVYYTLAPEFPVKADAAPSLFSAIISVAAIGVGFLATANSIILSIDNRQIIKDLKDVGYYSRLIDYLLAAVAWSSLLAILSIVCFLADLKAPESWHRWMFTIWVGLMFGAGFACVRIVSVFAKILKSRA